MGSVAKGLLKTPTNDETLIERLLRICRTSIPAATLCLVGQSTSYAALELPQLQDDPTGVGPIGGLRSLLSYAKDSGSERALALACDLPFLDETVLGLLNAPLASAARVPFVDGHFQPLAAAFSPIPTLAAVERTLAAGKFSLQRVLEELESGVERLESDRVAASALRDWDTPEDLER